LFQAALYYGDIVQVALVAVSAILAVVSIGAYRKRPDGRYLLLMLAFALLCITSAGTAVVEFFTGAGPAAVRLVEVYVVPSLELLMGVSFLVAILWSAKGRRKTGAVFVVAALAVLLAASGSYAVSQATPRSLLPSGCAIPVGGFLIVVSSMGYNDSIEHGAPFKSWPILNVAQGSDVKITVCNTYSQQVGFQVTHYLASDREAIAPGQVLSFNFIANETGSFYIYCAVFNPIHVYLQGGELNVL
jgi:hypothetical protein